MTEREIMLDAPQGKFTTLRRVLPSGALESRKSKTDVITFYWRGSHNDKSQRVRIGYWDAKLPPGAIKPSKLGFTINGAAVRAHEIAMVHLENWDTGGYLGAARAEKAKAAAVKQAQADMQKNSMGALLMDYCDYLKSINRKSHAEARRILRLHVINASPEIANLAAREITPEQITDLIRALLEVGKERTAYKLRSYLHAAYQIAATAKTTATVPVKFKRFLIASNPVGAVATNTNSVSRADKRPLTADEMRAYWKIIKPAPGLAGHMLRLHFLTGAQRIEQFVVLLKSDVRDDSITLIDSKGKPGSEPRAHIVPLIGVAKNEFPESADDIYAFSTQRGTHVSNTTLARWAQAMVGKQIADFQLKRVRSGVETLLASKGISSDIRGRLQSHGIAGVQARHYDGHDYLREKQQALELLFESVK